MVPQFQLQASHHQVIASTITKHYNLVMMNMHTHPVCDMAASVGVWLMAEE